MRPLRPLIIAAAVVLCVCAPPDEKVPPPAYDWGVAYWLSYDNDLERAGPIILKRVKQGVASDRQVAALQADYTDPHGMRRYVVTSNGTTETKLDSDDSANEDQAIAFLEWFVKTYPCKHYAFVFLNHGGRLDEMCLDEQPDTPGKEWMSGRVLGRKLRQFKAKMPGTLSLLFLQQCGRGSLENLYSFRGTADYILCSPAKIGAPNTYYTEFHKFLAQEPDAGGEKLARKIADTDKDFNVYLCIRGQKLDDLPARLNAALKPFLEKAELANFAPPRSVYSDSGEATRDAQISLQRLSDANNTGSREIKSWNEWIRDELVTATTFSAGAQQSRVERICRGPSVFVPGSHEEAKRYAELDLLKDSDLLKLWLRFCPPPPPQTPPNSSF
jgi:hypothetical protein